jgi:hypothetical protein
MSQASVSKTIFTVFTLAHQGISLILFKKKPMIRAFRACRW